MPTTPVYTIDLRQYTNKASNALYRHNLQAAIGPLIDDLVFVYISFNILLWPNQHILTMRARCIYEPVYCAKPTEVVGSEIAYIIAVAIDMRVILRGFRADSNGI
jgi:hypothetical protein